MMNKPRERSSPKMGRAAARTVHNLARPTPLSQPCSAICGPRCCTYMASSRKRRPSSAHTAAHSDLLSLPFDQHFMPQQNASLIRTKAPDDPGMRDTRAHINGDRPATVRCHQLHAFCSRRDYHPCTPAEHVSLPTRRSKYTPQHTPT
jgi:hypothetical protein